MKNFASRLYELRTERNLSQRELARQLNISQATIARWEANSQIPNVNYAIIIAKFFDVSTDYLLGITD